MPLPTDDLPLSRARSAFPLGEEYIYGFRCNDHDNESGDSYIPIVRLFGIPLVVVSDNDYQGDTRVLLRDGNRYGVLVIGFGSCSGCDALQACTTFEDVDRLIDDLEADVHWFDTLTDAQTYVAFDADRQLQHYWHCNEWADFKQQVLALSDTSA